MSKADAGHIMPDDPQAISRRTMLHAGAVAALGAASAVAMATEGPSQQFLRCKAQYLRWSGLVNAKWPKKTAIYDAYEKRVNAANDAYSFSLRALAEMPPSKQKLFELMSIASLESKGATLAGEEGEWLAAETALTAALQTFEALEVANV